jgi:hypothetical protein
MPIIVQGLKQIIAQGFVPDDEWEKIKREEAYKVEKEILSATPRADEDEQIGFNFRKNWKLQKLPKSVPFGSDFDYWNYVVDDAIAMWKSWAGGLMVGYHDYIAEHKTKGAWDKGDSLKEYAKSYTVWQNTKIVSENTPLEGPIVDFGPAVDFALFMEKWSSGNLPNLPSIYIGIGVLHAIGRKLASDWAGIHTVRVQTLKPKEPAAKPIPGRTERILLFPVIRILPRHYGAKR